MGKPILDISLSFDLEIGMSPGGSNEWIAEQMKLDIKTASYL